MNCFANNLPVTADREMAQSAVEAGVGVASPSVEHYSVIASQQNTSWLVRLHLTNGQDMEVWILDGEQNPASIRTKVSDVVAALRPAGGEVH